MRSAWFAGPCLLLPALAMAAESGFECLLEPSQVVDIRPSVEGVITLVAVVGRVTGFISLEEITRPRPNTGFIWHPDQWSFIVALLAGAAGTLALALSKTATMVGVFISVTTVPAAGNLALGLAFLDGTEIRGSAAQLGINIVCMVIAGAIVLIVMRWCWPWVTTASERLFGRQADLDD